MGTKKHEIVPTGLIVSIAGLRGGSGAHKSISTLAKIGLISRVKNAKCTVLYSLSMHSCHSSSKELSSCAPVH